MMKNKIWPLVILLALIISGYYLLRTEEQARGPIKLGAVLPLTGDGAYWGEHTQRAINLAVADINATGGIKGRKLELVLEDGQCDPKTGVSALQKLIAVDQVPAVIGEVCSSVTVAMAPIAQAQGVVLITPCSEAPDITLGRDYVFRTWTPNNRQALTAVDYALRVIGVTKFAVLSINNDFGNALAGAFTARLGELGAEIVAVEQYGPEDRDFKTQLIKIKAAKPEAIYLVSYPADGVIAVRQLKELGIAATIITTSGADSEEEFFGPLAELAEGIYFASLADATSLAFRGRYAKTYAKEWPGVNSCAGVAYDDVALIASAMRAVGTDPAQIKNYLSQVKDFAGVSGPITFDGARDLAREHSIFIYENGQRQLAPTERIVTPQGF